MILTLTIKISGRNLMKRIAMMYFKIIVWSLLFILFIHYSVYFSEVLPNYVVIKCDSSNRTEDKTGNQRFFSIHRICKKKVYLAIGLQMFTLEQVNQNYNNFSYHHLVDYFSICLQCITLAAMSGTTGHYQNLSA